MPILPLSTGSLKPQNSQVLIIARWAWVFNSPLVPLPSSWHLHAHVRQKELKGRTALVIAQRLSTIRNADKIIALEGGRIREVRDHALLSRGGLYSQLYRRQIELAAVGQGESGVSNNKSHS